LLRRRLYHGDDRAHRRVPRQPAGDPPRAAAGRAGDRRRAAQVEPLPAAADGLDPRRFRPVPLRPGEVLQLRRAAAGPRRRRPAPALPHGDPHRARLPADGRPLLLHPRHPPLPAYPPAARPLPVPRDPLALARPLRLSPDLGRREAWARPLKPVPALLQASSLLLGVPCVLVALAVTAFVLGRLLVGELERPVERWAVPMAA